MKKTIRNILISVFVIVWLCAFHYESLRAFYLNPLAHRNFPKIKFLFPPAGWIMFYNVGDGAGNTEVFGLKNGQTPQFIDPHQIFETRDIGYDNIHRGIMGSLLEPALRPQACRYLHRKFSYFEKFLVTYVEYPSLTGTPLKQNRFVVYQCE